MEDDKEFDKFRKNALEYFEEEHPFSSQEIRADERKRFVARLLSDAAVEAAIKDYFESMLRNLGNGNNILIHQWAMREAIKCTIQHACASRNMPQTPVGVVRKAEEATKPKGDD